MLERILIAGSGGQGVILIGRLLARVAAQEAAHVTFFPSYGAEVRGGTSNCQVVLSSEPIASPVSEAFDSMLIMNRASAERFAPALAPGGLAIVNGSLCPADACAGALRVPASRLADELGEPRCANMVVLGAFLGSRRSAVDPSAVRNGGLDEVLAGKPAALIDLNRRALDTGVAFVNNGQPGARP